MNEAGTERAGEIIDEIMSGSEFNRSGSSIDVSWLKPILEWINEIRQKVMEWLGRLLEKLFSLLNFKGGGGGGGGAKTVATVVLIVLGAAVLTGFIILAVKLAKTLKKKKKRDMLTEEDLLEFSEAPDAALELARKFRGEGDFRMAYRYLFINLLTELNRREVIRIARYKTNRFYMREAVNSGRVEYGEIAPFFSCFDRVWYGFKNIKQDELDRFFTARDAILFKIDSAVSDGEQEGGTGGEVSG